MTRRTLLRGSLLGGAGLAAAALLGCSGDDDDDSGGGEETTATATSTEEATAADETVGEIGRLVQDDDLPYPYEYPEPNDPPRKGGTFIHGSNFTNSNTDPIVNTTGGTILVINPVYDKLIGFEMGPEADSTKQELVPELATDWEISEDGLTYTFTIREGVTWQNVAPLDGRDFSAADVKYAYERMASDESIQKQIFSAVSSMDAPSPTEFVVTLNEPLVDFLTPLAGRNVNVHPQELVDNGTISSTAVGTGPMILDQIIDQQEVNFSANPDYWRDVWLDGAQVRIIQDNATRIGEFRVGHIDHGGNMIPTIQDAKNLEETNPDAKFSLSRVIGTSFAFAMNAANPKFSDERVRQALSLAQDRDLIIDVVWGGYARAHGMIAWVFIFDEEPTGDQLGKWMHYDPDEAKKMLMAAGAENLEIDDRHYNYLATWGATGEAFAENLSDIGVTLNLIAEDYNTFTTLWAGGNLEEATHSAWQTVGSTPDSYTYDNLYSQSPGNRFKIDDSVLDDLVVRQRTEHDPEARRELLKQIYDRDLDQMYRIPFPYGHSIEAINPRVRRLRLQGALTTVGVYDWSEQLNDVWLDI